MSHSTTKPVNADFSVETFFDIGQQRQDNHLLYMVFYENSNGRTRIADGVINWEIHDSPEGLMQSVLQWQTPYVRQHWQRIEVYTPNRDGYGNLKPGFIADTGILSVTRTVAPMANQEDVATARLRPRL